MNRIIFVLFLSHLVTYSVAQCFTNALTVDDLFRDRGELYFRFSCDSRVTLSQLTTIISVDHLVDGEIYAYANRKGFNQFINYQLPYEILPHPGTLIPENELLPDYPEDTGNKSIVWNFYPGYQQYLQIMESFAQNYPDLCKLDTIGLTGQGRFLLAAKISDNAAFSEPEPQILFTSSFHGDETTGYVLMLHLIDHLLSNYGTDSRITDLVNRIEIFINPLSNPDGTYHGGDNSVYGAVRYNAANVDLNRNFPDPKVGNHPDGEPWQPETLAFMDYAEQNHFTTGITLHGGAEVFNYPWDTWAKLHADDSWWYYVGREWADTVHQNGPVGYFDDQDNGVTNGHEWYEINGGHQDYMNYWHHCREATVEISNIKLLPVSQLLNFWNYNYPSFLNFIEQTLYGLTGIVSDSITGMPVAAMIYVEGHDADSSQVFSEGINGFYTRPIIGGDYDVTFTSDGYHPVTISNVSIRNRTVTEASVRLKPSSHGMDYLSEFRQMIYPNPCYGRLKFSLDQVEGEKQAEMTVFTARGNSVFRKSLDLSNQTTFEIDISGLPSGIYYLGLNTGKSWLYDRFVKLIPQHP